MPDILLGFGKIPDDTCDKILSEPINALFPSLAIWIPEILKSDELHCGSKYTVKNSISLV